MWVKKRIERHKKNASTVRAEPRPAMTGPIKEYEQVLAQACAGTDAKSVPSAVVIAADASGLFTPLNTFRMCTELIELGKILHSFATGTTMLSNHFTPLSATAAGTDVAPAEVPFNADTICWIASCTKVMASVAALQCVERGLFTLDEPVSRLLPELAHPDILLRLDEEKGAVLKPATKKITLRQLLTHSSGLALEFSHPKMFAWRKWWLKQSAQNRAMTKSTDPAIAYQAPLIFEPGEGWAYSTGIDWAGIMVSRASGLSLEDYMQTHVFKPLGMASTTFYPERHPALLSRIARIAVRDDAGNLSKGANDIPLAQFMSIREGGGGGCFSTANDYVKFLSSLLAPTCPLFASQQTREIMFSGHLSPAAKKALLQTHASPTAFGLAGNVPIGTDLDYGLGGIINVEQVRSTGRAAGTMQWGGLPNLMWFVNRGDGICGAYFSQLIPSGDKRSFDLYEQYERAVMKEFRGGGKGKL
jgi:CubicO group peptidase (beta-lactamase class C family)